MYLGSGTTTITENRQGVEVEGGGGVCKEATREQGIRNTNEHSRNHRKSKAISHSH